MFKKRILTWTLVIVMVACATIVKHMSLASVSWRQATQIQTHPDSNYLSFAEEKVPLDNKKVAYRMEKELKANSYAHLQTYVLHEKAARWFPIVEPILHRYGIPEDFKYIPLVESGLKSGQSSKKALGHWQFVPETARDYGLKVNRTVDERLNMRKSTIAACKYLRALFLEFKCWALVAAAYNLGENGVKRRMAKQQQRDYFKIRFNRETQTYVYKLISMKQIIEHPATYGYIRNAAPIDSALINLGACLNFKFMQANAQNCKQIFANRTFKSKA